MPTPDQIANLEMWYKADAITGLNDGDPVTTWSDSSVNNRDMTQPTASKKPIFKTNILNNKAIVRFDGVDDRLDLSGAILTGGSGTVFAVVDGPEAGTGEILTTGDLAVDTSYFRTLISNQKLFFEVRHNPTGLRDAFDGNTILASTGFSRLMWLSTGIAYEARVNNIVQTLNFIFGGDTGNWWGDVPNRDEWSIGVLTRLNPANFFAGDIAEIIVYSRDLTNQERNDIDDYLVAKYFPPTNQLNSDRIVPVNWFTNLVIDRVNPILWATLFELDRQIPIEWDLCKRLAELGIAECGRTDLSQACIDRIDRLIPIVFNLQVNVDRKIPIQWSIPSTIIIDRIVNVLWTTLLQIDRKIPIDWDRFEDWTAEVASQVDVWVKEGPSEQGIAALLGLVELGDAEFGENTWDTEDTSQVDAWTKV